MVKRNLAELVGQAVAEKSELDVESRTTEVTRYRTTDLPEFESTEVSKSLPRYLQLVRKDTRLREDQLAALTDLSRRLSRRRRAGGERITENTLIRVAIDLLLIKANKLGGDTEDELLRSLHETSGGVSLSD
jgi:hypothetical protein